MENVNKTNNQLNFENVMILKTLSKWSGFVGIITIISGILTCLSAFTTFGLSLIPGIITIVLGVKLRNTKKSLDQYINGIATNLYDTFENLSSYFKIQGILIIISLCMIVLAIIIQII